MSPHLLNYARTNTRQVDKCRTSAASEFTVGKIATTSDSSARKNRTDDHQPFPIKGNSSGLCVFVQLKFARRTVETTGWRLRFLVDETFSRSEACLFFYNGEKEREKEGWRERESKNMEWQCSEKINYKVTLEECALSPFPRESGVMDRMSRYFERTERGSKGDRRGDVCKREGEKWSKRTDLEDCRERSSVKLDNPDKWKKQMPNSDSQ